MGHRMQRGANRKSYITKMFPDKPHGKIGTDESKAKKQHAYDSEVEQADKAAVLCVFFLKPTAFTIKIESP